MKKTTSGFTIVELLIVIVVIAILAAISVVAYTGIQNRAAGTALQSDLRNAGTKLALDHARDGVYPSGSSVPEGLSSSPSTSLYYHSGDGSAYCLTATSSRNNVPAYTLSSGGSIIQGSCPGHPAGGGGGGGEIATNSPIQDVTSSQCAALPTFTGSNSSAIRTVIDTRGGTTRTYEIAKLADNKCWMLTNLKLGGSAPVTLTSADSNVSSNFTLPALTTSGASSDSPRVYGPVPGDSGSGATNYGYLYNFPSATAGETTTSLTSGNASSSICPASWRLPTGGNTSSDFAQLDIAFGGDGVWGEEGASNTVQWQSSGSFRGVYSGGWYDGGFIQSNWGNLWSASAASDGSGGAFYTGIYSFGVGPGGSSTSRNGGNAVRCVLNG